jgi:putative ABC transport system ATP-binding protein
VVLVTHEPRFASWADRIVRVRDGLLTEETRPADLADEIETAQL